MKGSPSLVDGFFHGIWHCYTAHRMYSIPSVTSIQVSKMELKSIILRDIWDDHAQGKQTSTYH